MAFRLAKDVQKVARGLIEEHHAHLQGVTVTAVFIDKIPTSKGRQVWARAKKVSGLGAFLIFAERAPRLAEHWGTDEAAPHDLFAVEVAEEVWSKLTVPAREALVDEALSSCEIEEDEETGSVKLAVVGPDISGWRDVVKRHGLWREDLEEFVRAGAEQLTLEEAGESGSIEESNGEVRPVRGQVESFNFSPETRRAAAELGSMGAEMTVVRGGRSS